MGRGRGTWDVRTPGRGTRGRGDAGTWDARTWDAGRRTRGLGTRDSKTLRLEDVGRRGLEDVINKQHMIFSLNL